LYEQLLSDAIWLPAARALPPDLDLDEPPQLDLPVADELEAGLAESIARLRSQLRSIGAIDLEALAAFRETRERYDHLVAQRADLEAAEADVVQVLSALEEEMDSRFATTFESVAAAFAITFPILFGGGEARLRMDDATSGVDIVARPPGKRRQPLALLSGGERALTAVALVFALLKASETPFVVLDEVDAALDEANVDRFRRALEDLAVNTQVVIITHNRGTVQTANTVYGISMAEDGASQSLSLRVEDLA
ncbi:MAG: AAA family ATPase, partial [Anaerolineae bacterium]